MEKERIHLEYVFDKVSKNSLWNHLTTPTGLSEWFADNVSIKNNTFTFSWNKMEQDAELIEYVQQSHARFRWLDEDETDYFEFRIHTTEITGAIVLEITDFVEENEREETINLWDSQIKTLKRSLGI